MEVIYNPDIWFSRIQLPEGEWTLARVLMWCIYMLSNQDPVDEVFHGNPYLEFADDESPFHQDFLQMVQLDSTAHTWLDMLREIYPDRYTLMLQLADELAFLSTYNPEILTYRVQQIRAEIDRYTESKIGGEVPDFYRQ